MKITRHYKCECDHQFEATQKPDDEKLKYCPACEAPKLKEIGEEGC